MAVDPLVVRPDPPGSAAPLDRVDAFVALSALHVTAPLGAVLRQVAGVVARTVPGTADVCVVATRSLHIAGVEFAGRLAATLDERQYRSGFGPSLDVARTGRAVIVDVVPAETAAADRYGAYRSMIRRHGVGRVVSLPLEASVSGRAGTAGSLTVYTRQSAEHLVPGHRSSADGIVSQLAAAASAIVADAVSHSAAVAEVAQLQEAMATRAVIEQAKGVIMGTERCTAEEAFRRLRDASMHSNRKLRDVAAEIVDTVGG